MLAGGERVPQTRVPPSCASWRAGIPPSASRRVASSPRRTDSVNFFEPTTIGRCAVAGGEREASDEHERRRMPHAREPSERRALRVDELRDERIGRRAHQLGERPALHDAPVAQEDDLVGERGRSPRSCVTSTTVLPSCAGDAPQIDCSSARMIGSSAPNGSSSSSASGSSMSARIRPTRWRWPPESSVG